MTGGAVIIGGISIPFSAPTMLAVVAVHVVAGLACAVTGIVAMLSAKGRGRHSNFGTIYFWLLFVVFATASVLSVARWSDDYHLFILGALAFSAALFGRAALRRRWQNWPRLHIAGMGTSYIVLLTAFYVDNGRSLPVWRDLPIVSYWTLPALIGVPIIMWAVLKHPVVLAEKNARSDNDV